MSKKWIQQLDVQEDGGKLIVEVAPLRRRHKPRIDVVSVSNTSSALSALVTMQDWTQAVTIRPHADGIFMDDDAINDTTNQDGRRHDQDERNTGGLTYEDRRTGWIDC